MTRVVGAGLATMLALTALAGCGVPTSSPVTTITDVPYGLMEPAAPATPRPSVTAERGPFIHWLDETDRLTPIEAGAGTSDPPGAVATVLTRLAAGPSELERMSGMSTALGPDVSLTLNRIVDGRAEIDIEIGTPAPSARRLPVAVGQIVLSLTSVSGIDSVVLMADGEPIEAPLPDGVLTARPLTAADFAGLVSDGPASRETGR